MFAVLSEIFYNTLKRKRVFNFLQEQWQFSSSHWKNEGPSRFSGVILTIFSHQILERTKMYLSNLFTRNHANSVTDCSTVQKLEWVNGLVWTEPLDITLKSTKLFIFISPTTFRHLSACYVKWLRCPLPAALQEHGLKTLPRNSLS